MSLNAHCDAVENSTDTKVWQTMTDISHQKQTNSSLGKMRQIESASTLAASDDDIDELEELSECDDCDDVSDCDDAMLLTEIEVVEAFKALDKNGDGLVSLSDIQRMLNDIGADLTENDFKEAVSDLFADCTGKVDLKHFASAFLGDEDVSLGDVEKHVPIPVEKASDAGCFHGIHCAVSRFFLGQ